MNNDKSPDATGLYEEMAGNVKVPVTTAQNNTQKLIGSYTEMAKFVSDEVATVLMKVNENEVNRLIDEIIAAEKVFFIGVGRVFLSHQCLAKRLAHFGINVNIVGSVIESPITNKDLLLVASGSGESKLPLEITKIAKKYNAKIALITSAQQSSIKSLSDIAIHLPAPTKTDMAYGVQSIQPMSTLFDQALHLFGDVLCLQLQKRTGQSQEDLKKRHANLE